MEECFSMTPFHHQITKYMIELIVYNYSTSSVKICKELKSVLSIQLYVKSFAQIELDCVVSFDFMLLMNGIS